MPDLPSNLATTVSLWVERVILKPALENR